MDAPADSNSEILARLGRGDVRGAAHLLVSQHADEVYALCRAIVRDPFAAEDLSQDVFGRAFSALPSFRGESSVRTWILKIARHRCLDHLRSRERRPWERATEDEPDAHPIEEPSLTDLFARREELGAALEALDEGERALVVLRFGHGLGYPELADAFGLREGTVRMRISRAVARMRAAIDAPPAESARRRTRAEEAPRRAARDPEHAARERDTFDGAARALSEGEMRDDEAERDAPADTPQDILQEGGADRRDEAPRPAPSAPALGRAAPRVGVPAPPGAAAPEAPPPPRAMPAPAPAPASAPPSSGAAAPPAPRQAAAPPHEKGGLLGRVAAHFQRGTAGTLAPATPPATPLTAHAPASLRARLEHLLEAL